MAASSRALVLGAGLVSRPLIEFLSRSAARRVVVASASEAELAAVAGAFGDRSNVEPALLDVAGDAAGLQRHVDASRVVVSLLPAPMHGAVAEAVLAGGGRRPDLVTASYVGDLAAVAGRAAAAGVRVVCEAGLDPGMDHMASMRLIDAARRAGERVVAFRSVCGGLPAPEVARTVPDLQYKFSWSVRGALVAAANDAAWVEDGRPRTVRGDALLAAARPLAGAPFGPDFDLECLPNRDSRPYAAKYGLDDAATVFRGTLRYAGGCAALLGLKGLGLLDDAAAPPAGATFAELVEAKCAASDDVPAAALARWLAAGDDAAPLDPALSVFDNTCAVLGRRLAYGPGERDVTLLRNEVTVETADGGRETRGAALVVYGDENATAMAKTVGLTAAVVADGLFNDATTLAPGLHTPVHPDVYGPALDALATEGLAFAHDTTRL